MKEDYGSRLLTKHYRYCPKVTVSVECLDILYYVLYTTAPLRGLIRISFFYAIVLPVRANFLATINR